jgi:hypothetical protein
MDGVVSILKDGQVIESDGAHGVVRLIRKAGE